MSTVTQTISGQLIVRTKMRKQTVSTIYHKGAMVPFLLRGNKLVYASKPIGLDNCAVRLTTDADGTWFEFGFLSAHVLEGNAAEGFQDPDHYVRLTPENSVDLVTFHQGNFIPAPSGAVVDNGDGTYWYWSRSTWPQTLKTVMLDLDLRSTRGKKSITQLKLFNAVLALPNYPYDVDTEMPQLQADLRAAGYAGAIASYSPAPYTVEITRYYLAESFSMDALGVIYTGETVTGVLNPDSQLIALPRYPYALPTQAATLQTDLVAAGYSGSVVRVMGGEWRISLPDRITLISTEQRNLIITFTPNDPFPSWGADNAYQGLIADNTLTQNYTNIRTAAGVPIVDASKRQFARLKLQTGSRIGANFLVSALLNYLKK